MFISLSDLNVTYLLQIYKIFYQHCTGLNQHRIQPCITILAALYTLFPIAVTGTVLIKDWSGLKGIASRDF